MLSIIYLLLLLSSLPPTDLLARKRAAGLVSRRVVGRPLNADERLAFRRVTMDRWRRGLVSETAG